MDNHWSLINEHRKLDEQQIITNDERTLRMIINHFWWTFTTSTHLGRLLMNVDYLWWPLIALMTSNDHGLLLTNTYNLWRPMIAHWWPVMTSVGTGRVAGALRHPSQDRHSAVCAQEYQPEGVQAIAATGIVYLYLFQLFLMWLACKPLPRQERPYKHKVRMVPDFKWFLSKRGPKSNSTLFESTGRPTAFATWGKVT